MYVRVRLLKVIIFFSQFIYLVVYFILHVQPSNGCIILLYYKVSSYARMCVCTTAYFLILLSLKILTIHCCVDLAVRPFFFFFKFCRSQKSTMQRVRPRQLSGFSCGQQQFSR